MKKLILLDGNAIVHRAYHGLPPLTTKTGETVHAVYGFALTLLSVLEKFKPEYVVATFDLPGGTFRDELYAEYKSHRTAAPDDLYAQIPVIKEMVTAFGIPIVEQKGFEADDCIGTLSLLGKEKKLEVVIVTGDTDTLQLVDEQVKVFTMRKSIKDTVVYGREEVIARYGFPPEKLIEYKGLAGDSSDNIPGVTGVGPKTATDLILKYNDLEGVYENLKDFKGKLLLNLEKDKKEAFLSRELGTIKRDVPVTLDLQAAELSDYDQEKAIHFLQKYEFYSLIKRLPGVNTADISQPLERQKIQKITYLKTKESAHKFFTNNQEAAVVVQKKAESLFGGGIEEVLVASKSEVVRVDWQSIDVKMIFTDWLSSKDTIKIFFDAKKVMHLFKTEDMPVKGLIEDVQVLAYLCEVSYDKTLESLFQTLDIAQQGEVLGLYKSFCVLTEKLKEISKQQEGEHNLYKVYTELERPLIPVLFAMEERGITLNKETFKNISKTLSEDLEKLAAEIYALAGKEFNINSPKQLAEILFIDLGIPTGNIKKTKTGISTASSELQKLGEYEIAGKIEEYRELFKLKSTYLDAFPLLVANDGKLHTTYQQTVAATGRLSSLDPNLQNIPARGQWSERVRSAFEASSGFLLVGADYSQIELRIMAHLSQDKELLQAFRNNEDVHTTTASVVYKVSKEAVTKEMRQQAKVFNFGLMYGMGAFGLAQAAGITQTEAKEFIALYFKKFKGVKAYIESIIEETKINGYQETEIGRRRHIPEIQSSNLQVMRAGERMAVNMPIQGLEADIVKIAMLKGEELVKKYQGTAFQLLQVHDEIIFEVEERQAEQFAQELSSVMESVYTLSVPLPVEVSIGKNWGEI